MIKVRVFCNKKEGMYRGGLFWSGGITETEIDDMVFKALCRNRKHFSVEVIKPENELKEIDVDNPETEVDKEIIETFIKPKRKRGRPRKKAE